MRRRDFLRTTGLGAAGTLLGPTWAFGQRTEDPAFAEDSASAEGRTMALGETRIVILHTNDTHSRIDPFPMDGGPLQGLGGVARRATLVERVREENNNVLLLDSGDVFQGTPYFNFFKGELEFRAMSAMGYDVATIGNHDFDNGVDGLVEMMPHAEFQFVSANYDVSGSALEPHVRPWVIREVGGVKVGIFGLGIAFEGLVLAFLHEGVRYTDPYAAAERAVQELRGQGCSLVVCLSHLGYRYRDDLPSDTVLAQRVEGIDIILGGHTHTFLDQPDVYSRKGRQTLVNQVGWGGVRLGRIDVVLGSETHPDQPAAGPSNTAPSTHSIQPWGPRPVVGWTGGGYAVDGS